MNDDFCRLPLATVRALIAHAFIPKDRGVSASLGGITLRDTQRRSAERLLSEIDRSGGVLLADPVGVGKTFIALAVARRYTSVLVLAPAALRDMWHAAVQRAGCCARVVTHEALSVGTFVAAAASLVIVDESHRLRSPDARRYAAAAELCRGARVLLVTATPIHNRIDDLRAQLALFLGTEAWTCADSDLARHIVRDGDTLASNALPALDGPHLIELPEDDNLLDELLALPAPIPAADEGVANSLAQFGLVHQWASSRAALCAALQRRRRRGLALLAALEAGRRPTREELLAWSGADGALQLAFPELVTAESSTNAWDAGILRMAVLAHLEALDRLLARACTPATVDASRAEALTRIRGRHSGERIIAFSQYAETVETLYRRLVRSGRVAMLTARGARIASGRVPRREVLHHFTHDSNAPERDNSCDVDRVDLLLTTDLLSEGLNLQRASVVVHLDLPWNPARLDQRVGRARRLGATHDVVTVYTFAPPAAPNRLLGVERRLRDKLSYSENLVGVAGRILPLALAPPEHRQPAAAEQITAVRDAVARWTNEDVSVGDAGQRTVVSAALGNVSGYLALVRVDAAVVAVADLGAGIRCDTTSLLQAIHIVSGRQAEFLDTDAEAAHDGLLRWVQHQRGRSIVDLRAAATARARRTALVRVARTLARTPRQRLPIIAPLAGAVRRVASAPMGAGAEHVFESLVRAELPDEAWLRAVATFGEANAMTPPHPLPSGEVIAIVLLRLE